MDSINRRNTLEAINPADGTLFGVYLPNDLIQIKGKRSFGDAFTIARVVPYVLKYPAAIFEGLRDERDENRNSAGWRCYCGRPPFRYKSDGTECNPYPLQVFLVFVDSENVVYQWYWSQADLDSWNQGKYYPVDYSERFREQLL